jgi:hypothetical protein
MKRKIKLSDFSVSFLLGALCTITTLVCNLKKGFALKHIRHICEQHMGDYVKASPLALIVISLCIVFVLSINSVYALEPNEASVELLWSSQAVYSGDFVTVRITFTSSSADQLKIYRIGLHFGWMDENEFYTSDLTGSPVTVSGFGTHMFDPIAIQIPINVSAGTYDYFVGVDGTQGASLTTFSWDSSTFTLQIHPATEKFYNQLKSQVESNLAKANSANYRSSEAQSLLEQAQTAYNSALSSAIEEQWAAAISSLENASTYLDQASAAEQEGEEQSEHMQSLLLYLVIAVVVVIVVVSVVVLVVRRRRRRTDSMAEQPMETYDEEQG